LVPYCVARLPTAAVYNCLDAIGFIARVIENLRKALRTSIRHNTFGHGAYFPQPTAGRMQRFDTCPFCARFSFNTPARKLRVKYFAAIIPVHLPTVDSIVIFQCERQTIPEDIRTFAPVPRVDWPTISLNARLSRATLSQNDMTLQVKVHLIQTRLVFFRPQIPYGVQTPTVSCIKSSTRKMPHQGTLVPMPILPRHTCRLDLIALHKLRRIPLHSSLPQHR
jgi:hypothetical protein